MKKKNESIPGGGGREAVSKNFGTTVKRTVVPHRHDIYTNRSCEVILSVKD